jgi:hypothetical protein
MSIVGWEEGDLECGAALRGMERAQRAIGPGGRGEWREFLAELGAGAGAGAGSGTIDLTAGATTETETKDPIV